MNLSAGSPDFPVAEGIFPAMAALPAFESNGEMMMMDTIVPHPASLRALSMDGQPTVPASPYATPREVMEDSGLSRAEKREILAFWASDACAVDSRPALRQPPGAATPVPYDDIRRALRELDGLDPDWPPSGGASSARPFVRRRVAAWWGAGAEPTVEEALADPIVRLVMARDGVQDTDVYRVIAQAGGCIGRRPRIAGRG